MKKGLILVLVGLLVGTLFIGLAEANSFNTASFITRQTQAPSFQTYYSSNDIRTFWPQVLDDPEQCEARQDIILQVAPGGCSPGVVRSDLLAEQNVPVFCQVDAFKINPLLKIEEIRNIRFSQETRDENVVGVGFHPARAALATRDRLLGDPVVNNIGYVTVVLKQNEIEDSLPDSVKVDLSAQIQYESGNPLGIGRANFLLRELDDAEWQNEKNKQTFWNGQYFVRLEELDTFGTTSVSGGLGSSSATARISLYQGDRRVSSVNVRRGETSRDIYMPGSYCQAGIQVRFDGFESARTTAVLEITGGDGTEKVEVSRGGRFLNDQCRLDTVTVNNVGTGTGNVRISCPGQRFSLSLTDSINSELNDKDLDQGNDEFDEAVVAYEKLLNDFPFEESPELMSNYAENGLVEIIDLAKRYQQRKTLARLLQQFVDTYPDSEKAPGFLTELNQLSNIDGSFGGASVDLGNKIRNVRLVAINEPENKGEATFTWGTERIDSLKLDERKTKGDKFIELDSVGRENVRLSSNCNEVSRNGRTASVNMIIGESVTLCGEPLVLRDTETNELARISLIPRARNTNTEANLTVQIGVDKRDIKLSPEKTEEKIQNLDASIEKWERISDTLGGVTEGFQAACFATAGALTLKNFFAGLSGESLARQQVMEDWKDVCRDEVSDGLHGGSMDVCFNSYDTQIDRDVNARKDVIQKVNSDIEQIQSSSGVRQDGDNILDSGSVNSQEAAKRLATKIRAEHGDRIVSLPAGKRWHDGRTEISVNDLLSEENVENRAVTYTEIRGVYADILSEESAGDFSQEFRERNVIGTQLSRKAGDITENVNYRKQSGLFEGLETKGAPRAFGGLEDNRRLAEIGDASRLDGNVKDKITTGRKVATFYASESKEFGVGNNREVFDQGSYILELEPSGDGYRVVKAHKVDRDLNWVSTVNDENGSLGKFNTVHGIGPIKPASTASYTTPIKEIDRKVRFYDNEPYKGMPAIVPVDSGQGWYAGTRQTLPVGGGIGAFDASGRVTSFWLCHVGDDGSIDFERSDFGDDTCKLVNRNTGQPIGSFPGIAEESFVERLVVKAERRIMDAARQYDNGGNQISLDGERLLRGTPYVGVPETSCQDFMSPSDCHIMFNVCDPVVCPSSRCDFGGKYPVSNVIETGIIGGALMCLPNFQEGIYVPLCLSGINAGVDGYLSVLEAHQECLQESLETGRTTGICDQIHSVYSCEFFWRQLAPLSKVIVPKVFEKGLGQGTRGGGEYLTVQNAWQNTKQSVDYFTNSYGVNTFNAFRARNIEEAGGEFCKAFISAKAPTSFDSLVQPPSPAQFHAYFSSTRFTDATVPATAQYKVFYHIFAGRDAGSSYRIYLRNPPEGGYYAANPILQVESGFVGKGDTISETRDFTGPEGYTELCVDINGQQRCGFKQVSTSFALNQIRDAAVADELTNVNINSENECVSGGVNAAALLNPNLQQAADEAANPAIYRRGVVRICSTGNPGSATDPTRFTRVGHCGSESVGCWLDGQSIENAITDNNKGVQQDVLERVTEIQKDNLVKDQQTRSIPDGKAELDEIEGEILDFDVSSTTLGSDLNIGRRDAILNRLQAVQNNLFFNHQKAWALLLDARLKAVVADALLGRAQINENERTTDDPRTDVVVATIQGDTLYFKFDGTWKWSETSRGTYRSLDDVAPKYVAVLRDLYGLNEEDGINKLNEISEVADDSEGVNEEDLSDRPFHEEYEAILGYNFDRPLEQDFDHDVEGGPSAYLIDSQGNRVARFEHKVIDGGTTSRFEFHFLVSSASIDEVNALVFGESFWDFIDLDFPKKLILNDNVAVTHPNLYGVLDGKYLRFGDRNVYRLKDESSVSGNPTVPERTYDTIQDAISAVIDLIGTAEGSNEPLRSQILNIESEGSKALVSAIVTDSHLTQSEVNGKTLLQVRDILNSKSASQTSSTTNPGGSGRN